MQCHIGKLAAVVRNMQVSEYRVNVSMRWDDHDVMQVFSPCEGMYQTHVTHFITFEMGFCWSPFPRGQQSIHHHHRPHRARDPLGYASVIDLSEDIRNVELR